MRMVNVQKSRRAEAALAHISGAAWRSAEGRLLPLPPPPAPISYSQALGQRQAEARRASFSRTRPADSSCRHEYRPPLEGADRRMWRDSATSAANKVGTARLTCISSDPAGTLSQ
jgi:hypothetical protein